MKTEIVEGETVRTGSANVFADLGLSNPEERLLKARLMSAINAEIRRRALTQQQAGELVGLKQPELSRIANGRGAGFSTDRLIEVLRHLGCDVEISVSIASGPVGELRCQETGSPMKPVTIESSSKALSAARSAYAFADKNEARASAAHYSRSRDAFAIRLRNGIELLIPRRLLQGLAQATAADASRIMIVDKGSGLRWPTLDVDLTVTGLVSGVFGTKTWMSELGRAGGGRSRKREVPA
jgi:predicted XRE-type DNA-binding protein